MSFTYINNFSALYPGFGGTSLYANSSLPLAAGSANLLGAYNAANIELDTHDDTSLPGYYYANTGDTNPAVPSVHQRQLRGTVYLVFPTVHYIPSMLERGAAAQSGDSVKILRVAMPQFKQGGFQRT